MNVIKKLREMGFKKSLFMKISYDKSSHESIMIPDIEKIVYNYIDGKKISKIEKKEHPKSNSFWKLDYNRNYTIWCLVKNYSINTIWLENNSQNKFSKERIIVIYDYDKNGTYLIISKSEIINLFPKEIKRNLLIEQLFG